MLRTLWSYQNNYGICEFTEKLGNSADKLRHTRTVVYTVELLNFEKELIKTKTRISRNERVGGLVKNARSGPHEIANLIPTLTLTLRNTSLAILWSPLRALHQTPCW